MTRATAHLPRQPQHSQHCQHQQQAWSHHVHVLTVDLITSKVSDLGGTRVAQPYLPDLGISLFEIRRYHARSVFVGIVLLCTTPISFSIRCRFLSFTLQQGLAGRSTFIGRCTMATNDLEVDRTRLLVATTGGDIFYRGDIQL